MTKTTYRTGLGAIVSLALLAAPAAFAQDTGPGKTSSSAAGTAAEPSSKGAGAADKQMQEGAGSSDKAKQKGANEAGTSSPSGAR